SRTPAPEISATPLATEVAQPPPPTTMVEPVLDLAPPPTEIVEMAPGLDEPEPPPTTTTVDTPRVRTPSIALTTLSAEDATRGRDCLAHNDFACAIAVYRTSRDPRD